MQIPESSGGLERTEGHLHRKDYLFGRLRFEKLWARLPRELPAPVTRLYKAQACHVLSHPKRAGPCRGGYLIIIAKDLPLLEIPWRYQLLAVANTGSGCRRGFNEELTNESPLPCPACSKSAASPHWLPLSLLSLPPDLRLNAFPHSSEC